MHAGKVLRELRKNLNWSQVRLALAIGLSAKNASSISLIERGHRRLSSYYLEKIESAYVFEGFELLRLREHGAIDLAKDKLNIDLGKKLQAPLEGIEKLLADIHNLRMQGHGGVAQLLPQQIERLEDYRLEYRSDLSWIDRLLGKAIIEWVASIVQTASENKTEVLTEDYIVRIRRLEYALREDPDEAYEIARLLRPTVLYAANKLEASTARFRTLLDQVTTTHSKTICLRSISVASALLAEQGKLKRPEAIKRFRTYEDIALNDCAEGLLDAGDRAHLLEGLSLARGKLGLSKAQERLDEAKDEYRKSLKEGTNLPAARAGIARTEFSNLVRNPESDPQIALASAQRARRIFEQFGMTRYREQLVTGLRAHGNKLLREFGEHLITANWNRPAPRAYTV